MMSCITMDRMFHQQITGGMPGEFRLALRRAYRVGEAAHKRCARDAAVSPRTARGWFDGHHLPRLHELVRLMANRPEIEAEVAALVRAERDAPAR